MSARSVQIFCDFDGTISERDLITTLAVAFAGDEAQAIIDQVNGHRLTVKEGVTQMFAMIPSHRYPELVAFARARTVIRAGFDRFVREAIQRGWQFSIVSGGFDFFVDPVAAPYQPDLQVFCNRLRHDGPFLKVEWGVECDANCEGGCGLCKPTVMRQAQHGWQARAAGAAKPGALGKGLDAREQERAGLDSLGKRLAHPDKPFQVVIGDGVTDLKAARLADAVFARSRLADACEREGIAMTRFEDFSGIAGQIAEGGERDE